MNKVLLSISNNIDTKLIAELLSEEEITYESVNDISDKEIEMPNISLIIVDVVNARKGFSKLKLIKEKNLIFIPIIILLPSFEKAERWLSECFDDIIRIPTTKKELKTRIKLYIQLHKQSEEIFKNSERKYRTIFEATGTIMLVVAEDTTILMANSNVSNILGYTPEELIGTSWTLYASPKDKETMIRYHYLRRTQPEAAPRGYETRVIHKNGDEIFVYLTATMIPHTKDSVISLMDITELKKAELKARESDERLRMAFETTPDAIAISRLEDGKCIEINEGFEKLSGFNKTEIIGHTSTELNIWLNVSDRDIFVNHLLEQQKITNYDCELRKKNGNIFPALVSAALVKFNGEDHIITITRDITELKTAYEKISLLSTTIEQNPIATLIIDINGKVVFTNKYFTEVTGFTQQDISNDIHMLFKKNDFTGVSMQEILARLQYPKNQWSSELLIVRKDNSTFWALVKLSSISTIENTITHYLLTLEDITEKKKILDELLAAKNKAEESDRLKTAFLHNISHEIRTPMNAIMGFSDFLKESELPEEKRKQYVDIIIRSGNQLLNIINDIINIAIIESGQEKLYPSVFNLVDVIKLVYQQYLPIAQQKNITLKCDEKLFENNLYLQNDKTKLTQILSNLVGNAIKFTDTGYVDMGYHLEENEILFYVHDTGIGIPTEFQKDIFKRFHQVKNKDKFYGGSGLGLAISKAYIDMMGGRIWVNSTEGKGSSFYFTLPMAHFENEEHNVKSSDNQIFISQKKKILIAEDEDSNFALLEEYLANVPVEIIRAKNGEEAIMLFEREQSIDLILMDIKMPKKDGIEATIEIKKRNPNIPIIAQTAYTLEEDKEKIALAGCNDYLSKPLTQEKFIQTISRFLR